MFLPAKGVEVPFLQTLGETMISCVWKFAINGGDLATSFQTTIAQQWSQDVDDVAIHKL